VGEEVKIAGDVRADRGSVAAGRDVVARLLVTGDRNTFFVGGYQRLSEAYVDAWSVFERVRLDRFMGREWLETEVDRFLDGNDRGYFVLEAKAGVGKSTFLAHLIQERAWIHHFVELAPGEAGVGTARKNLAAQLLRAYDLAAEREEPVLPDEAASRPDFLGNLLRQASEKRKGDEKIVLVVDGLDEAGTRSGENVLGLPRVLPAGVFFLVSKRPVPVALDVERPRRVVTLDPESVENLTDVRTYLEGATRWPGIACALEESTKREGGAYSAEEFVSTLLTKSHGIWVYLHYVLSEIEDAHRRDHSAHPPLDLDAIPEGLWAYYIRFWRRWKADHGQEWHRLHLPVLATLAAVREEVSLDRLRALSAVDELPELPDRWRPMLAVERADEPRYRVYHATLTAFLHGQVEHDNIDEDEQNFAAELARATQKAHFQIANRYLSTWGGLDANLPGLRDELTRDVDDRYGLRHVADHLSLGCPSDLHRLLRLESPGEGMSGAGDRRTNTWFMTHDAINDLAGYVSDVTIAWQLAEREGKPAVGSEAATEGGPVGLQCRYALITSSVNSLATNVSPDLLVGLVEEDIWTWPTALANARHITDGTQRVQALTELVAHFGQSSEIRTDVLAAAREIQTAEWRAAALTGIAAHLPNAERPAVVAEALSAARAIDFKQRFDWIDRIPLPPAAYVRAAAIAELIPLVAEEDRPPVAAEAMSAAVALESRVWGEWKASLLRLLAEHLEPDERPAALAEADRALEETTSPILALPEEEVPYRHPEAMLPNLADAMVAVRAIDYAPWRSEALCQLSSRLPKGERCDLMIEAWASTRAIDDESSQQRALKKLAAHDSSGSPARSGAASAAMSANETGSEASSRDAFAKALADALGEDDAYQREGRLQRVAHLMTEIHPAEAYPLWCQTLHGSATRVRSALLSDLGALTPVIFRLGGEAAIAESTSAIADVGRWFP
jgi:hypothetical protein